VIPTSALAKPQTAIERLPEEWESVLHGWGEPKDRALQVFRWIHQRGVTDVEQMTDLPKSLRTKLLADGLAPLLKVAESHKSIDGTRKLLVEMNDGRRVETVLIPRAAAHQADTFEVDDEDGAHTTDVTQCVSSQVGCAMGCGFCASGIAGLKRQMSAGEIVSQVLLANRDLAGAVRIAGIVYMGMGEPLHNYAAVARSIALLTHPEGMGLSTRRITVSTSGLVKEIERLGKDFGGRVRLAVSLHASNDEARSRIMPVNRKHNIDELMTAVRAYPLPPFTRITIEYTLIEGVNASSADARKLAELLDGLRAKVNLIPMNPVPDAQLHAPTDATIDIFQDTLRRAGIDVFVRKRKGDDIAAACGQLALHGEKRKIRLLTQQ
jgi:23S rRNA (adenine2503-C2)-methyltransferase